jgi:hypothetical protein
MTDDQIDVKEEIAEEEVSDSTSSVEEPKATEEVLETPEETESTEEEPKEEEETETEDAPKKGANQRIRELNQRAKQAEAKAQSLAERLAETTGSVEPSTQYTPQVQPGAEISPEQYQSDVLRAADGLVTLRIKQSEAVNKINTEANEALRAYPELDPDSESFDKELSDSITEAVDAQVRVNPYTTSVKKVVDNMMKPYRRAVSKQVGKETENMARQVSQSALRPTAVRQQEKKTEDMTIAELEAEIGIVQS